MGGLSLFHWLIVLVILGVPAFIIWRARSAKSPSRDSIASPQVDAASPVRPWVRYWARMLDIYLACIIAALAIDVIAPDALNQRAGAQLFGLGCLLAWVFIESFLLSTVGTTPGKWLLRTQLISPSGGKPSYSAAFSRSHKVWWRGLGIGFPLASLITLSLAHGNLTKNRITSWDRDDGFTIVHQKIGPLRIIVAVAFFAAFLALVVLGNSAGA